MKCPGCGSDVRDSERNCPVCQHDCGCPNVRAAQRPEEIRALEERVRKAEVSAATRGSEPVLSQFRQTVRTSSRAVFCRQVSQVLALVSSDNDLYVSFYQLVGMGARRPEDTPTEQKRLMADDLLFPHYKERICFAALSLDGSGAASWGSCSVVLKDPYLQSRATVFEENSVYFCVRRDLGVNRGIPPGYRAMWDRRDELAAAKLEAALQPGMTPDEFPGVLLDASPGQFREEFIEVHIWGALHRRNVERVVVGKPKASERPMVRQMAYILQDPEIGATIEVRS